MPTDWESRYQTGDMPWEKGAPSPGLVDYLKEHAPLEGNILVPGCGYGHDVRAISRADNEVTGIDIAPSAMRGAQGYPVTGREIYKMVDLFELPPEMKGHFDWVWEHTCFCAIDPSMRTDYVRAVAEALKPRGRVLAVFYLDPENDEGGPPFNTTKAELDALFGNAFELVSEWLPLRTYPSRVGCEWMRVLQKR